MDYDDIVVTLVVVLSKGLEWRNPSREFLLDLQKLIPKTTCLRTNFYLAAIAAIVSPPVYKTVGLTGKTELTFEFGHRFERPSGSPRHPDQIRNNFMRNEVWSLDHKKIIINLAGETTPSTQPPDPLPEHIENLWAELESELEPLSPLKQQ